MKPAVVCSTKIKTNSGVVEFERYDDGALLITTPEFSYLELSAEDTYEVGRVLGFDVNCFEEFKTVELAKLEKIIEARVRAEMETKAQEEKQRNQELMERITREDPTRGIKPSDHIKMMVSIEENGTWGANVGVCTTGEARIVRYYYDRRMTARNAKFSDKVGENGRVA